MADDQIPIYRYTVTLAGRDEELTADAMSYREDGPWLIFDVPDGTVLSIRSDAVAIIKRGDPVGSATVEPL